MAGYTEDELKGKGIKVGGMLYVETTDGVAALAGQVYDTRQGKSQEAINAELAAAASPATMSDEEAEGIWAAAIADEPEAAAAKGTAFGLKRVKRITRL